MMHFNKFPASKLRINRVRVVTLLLLLFQSVTYGQVIRQSKARVENIDFFLVDDKIKIIYDLEKGKDWEIFDIAVKIYNAADTSLLPAKTLSGDITAIKPGKGKIITWDIKSDMTYLDQNIFIELEAIPTNPKMIPYTSKTKAVLLSTVLPGWGSSKTTLHNANYLKGVAAYSLAGTSLMFNLNARTNYDKYLDANTSADRDNYFSKAESDLTTSHYLAFGAISVWLIEYTWILIAQNRTDASILPKTSFNINFIQDQSGLVVPSLTLTCNF